MEAQRTPYENNNSVQIDHRLNQSVKVFSPADDFPRIAIYEHFDCTGSHVVIGSHCHSVSPDVQHCDQIVLDWLR